MENFTTDIIILILLKLFQVEQNAIINQISKKLEYW